VKCYFFLREPELRERRGAVLARQLEISEVEGALSQALKAVQEEIKVIKQ